MDKHEMNERYFRFMTHLVCGNGYGRRLSWRKLFRLLHETEFIYIMDIDANRADDGTDLRYRFAYEFGLSGDDVRRYLDCRPCSVLEMMVALASRCEEQIMDNPDYGDRTGKWFFDMIDSLGLGGMDDAHFDEAAGRDILCCFMRREYQDNGQGGLFTLRNPRYDMRRIEIWYQMMGYLEENERWHD